jgi:hypothetical protein
VRMRGRIAPLWPCDTQEASEIRKFKSETVNYGRESQGIRTQERLRWQEPAVYTKGRPILSSERTPHKTDRHCQTVINIWS